MSHDQTYDEVDERFETILRALIERLRTSEAKDSVSSALLCLLLREWYSWQSIRVLQRHTPVQCQSAFMVDAGTLLRAMFDAYLQAERIFRDPAIPAELASQYLDFEHIERYRLQQTIMRHNNPLVDALRNSPHKDSGEMRVQQEYDRVKEKYLIEQKQCDGTVKRGPRTRDTWYQGTLHHLAQIAGREDEYDTFLASFNGCVHSSVFAIRHGPLVPEAHIVFLASTFTARVAAINVDYNRLDIGADRIILQEFCKTWLDEK